MYDFTEMTIEEMEARKAEIRKELDMPDADIEKLGEEARAIVTEIEKRKADEAKKAEVRAAVAAGTTPITMMEQRKDNVTMENFTTASPEYRSAFFKTLQRRELTDIEQRAMTTASGSAGAAVPVETANLIVNKMLEVAPMLSQITLLRAAKGITIATGLTKDDAYQHGQGNTITASSDVLAQVTLGVYGFAKVIKVSLEVQTMAIPAFEAWLVENISEAIALKIEKAIIQGTGTNEPGGLGSITLTSGTNLISTTADITYKNICDLMTYPDKGFRRNCKFLCNSSFPYTQLAGIKDSQNRPLFVESMQAGVPARLMGREVLISDEVPDNVLWYGEFNRIYGNLSRDIDVAVSDQADFDKALIDYRGYAMFDCKVAAPRAFGKFVKN